MNNKRSVAVAAIIENLAHYQETANRTASIEELRGDPVPGMLKMLTSGRYFAFMDQLNSAPHVQSWIVSVNRYELGLLMDFSRVRTLEGERAASEREYHDDQPRQFIIETGAGSEMAAARVQRMEEARLRQKSRDLSPSRGEGKVQPGTVSLLRARSQTCHLCGSVLINNQSLIEHWQVRHPDFAPSFCSICRRAFRNESEMRKHVEGHTRYKCSLCPWDFTKRSALVRHIAGHTASGVGCQYCSYSSRSKRAISVHESRHPEEAERRALLGLSTAEAHVKRAHRRAQNRRAAQRRRIKREAVLASQPAAQPAPDRRSVLAEALGQMSLETARAILDAWDVPPEDLEELDQAQIMTLLRRTHGERVINGKDIGALIKLGRIEEIAKRIKEEEEAAQLKAEEEAIKAEELARAESDDWDDEDEDSWDSESNT